MFAVREEVVVAGVTQKNKTEPSTHIGSEGGVAVASITQKRIKKPSTHVCSEGVGGGSHHHPEKQNRTLHSCLQQGRGWWKLVSPRKA
jgi:hypothetical protein